MRLTDAAAYFDQQVCTDAFTPFGTFKAQLDLFDDSKRDGTTGARRILSVASDVVVPASGAIILGGHTFILGGDHEDVFAGSVIRRKYTMQEVETASIKTLAQAAAGLAGTATFASKIWVKDIKEVDQTSRMFPYFNVFLPSSTPAARRSVVMLGTLFYMVRATFESAGGFTTAECNELTDTQPQTVAYVDRSGQVYDPATDKVGALTTVNALALVIRFEDYYERLSTEAPKNQPGDVCLAIAKSLVTAPGTGDEWTSAAGVLYRVQAVSDDGGTSWLLHSRRA